MLSIHVRAVFRHVMAIDAWIVVNCMHLIYNPKCTVIRPYQDGVTWRLPRSTCSEMLFASITPGPKELPKIQGPHQKCHTSPFCRRELEAYITL